MSLLNHNEQYDLVTSMKLEREDEIERTVRELAQKYLTGREPFAFGPPPPPTRTQFILQTGQALMHGPRAAYAAPSAPYSGTLDAHYIELYIDVAPGIDGFAAQMIAEEQLREQIGKLDTTF